MSAERTCPDCGSTLPADSPRGLCPRCLMGAALWRPSPGEPVDSAAFAREPGALETIARSIGPVPRVLLRDTPPGEGPGPVVRPDAALADATIRYRIDGEIARGGMGVVLKGRDPDLGRDVALKVLREDLREDADLVRRMVEEAQIGGQLQHPGVVPIYELGTLADGRPFFSMKLVKGRTLAQLLAARPDAPAELPRFLSIFEAVCQTMAYAHARGVIHRDLKPSNVMVGAFGEVQVMDWGLAKVLPRGGVSDDAKAGKEPPQETVIATAQAGSETDLSRAGSVLGTPSYMAPEQARGDIHLLDERCDVFALGSILCEILTGRPAFTGRGSGEILRKSARGETAEARARLDTCGADAGLITLAQDSLAPEADDRPRDGHEVASRVTAHLTGVQERLRAAEVARAAEAARAEESVRTAEAAEARARAERGARRLTVALAGSILALAALGGGGYAFWARQQAERQAAAASAVERSLEDAIAKFGQARGAGRDPAPWAEARAAASRAVDEANKAEAPEPLRRRVRGVLDEIEQLDKNRRFVATLLEISSSLQDRAGWGPNLFQIDRRYRQAFREYGADLPRLAPEEAATLIRDLGGDVTVQLAAALDDWTRWRTLLAAPYVAEQLSPEQAERFRADDAPRGGDWLVAINRLLDPDPLRNRIRDAAARKDDATLEAIADEIDPAATLALTINALAWHLIDHDRGAAAGRLYRKAQPHHIDNFLINYNFALFTGLAPAEQLPYLMAAVALRPRSAVANMNLAQCLKTLGRRAEAVGYDLRAAEADPKLWLQVLFSAAELEDEGQGQAAASACRKALELAGKTPLETSLDYAPNLVAKQAQSRKRPRLAGEVTAEIAKGSPSAQGWTILGIALLVAGEVEQATDSFKKAVRLAPRGCVQLGRWLSVRGRHEIAEAVYREALRLEPNGVDVLRGLGQALAGQGRHDEAIALFEQVRDARIAELGPDDPDTLAALTDLARAHRSAKRFDRSAPLLEEVLKRREAKLGRRPRETQMAVADLGVNYKDSGRLDEAIPLLEEAYQARGQFADLRGFGAPLLEAYAQAGRSAEAAKVAQDIVADARKDAPKGSPQLALALALSAQALLRLKAYADAEPLLHECLAIREKAQPDDWSTFNARSMLGEVRLSQKKYAEAEPLLVSGYDGMKRREATMPAGARVRLTEALERLVQLCEAAHQPDEAARWRAELEARKAAGQSPEKKP
jgi:Tfp pilus assembly protein PilF/tRNA A-37 threonylcarbamoyl transferase component Bud32